MINKPTNEISLKILMTNRLHLIYSGAVVLTIVAVLLVGLIPQIQESLSLNSELNKEKPVLEKLRSKLVELDDIQFTPEFAQYEIVNSALPSRKPLLELLSSLQAISLVNEIIITNLELSPGEIATDSSSFDTEKNSNRSEKVTGLAVEPLEIYMDVSGRENQIREFLTLLEKITPFTTITQLSIERSSAISQGSNIVDASITTETYFFTKPLTAAVEAPLVKLTEKDRSVLSILASFVENDLPEQTEITGGGLQDLFGVDPLNFD